MGQRHRVRTPTSAAMLALPREFSGDVQQGGNGNVMVILFFSFSSSSFILFLMSIPLPSTAERGRQEKGGHGGWWQGTKRRDLLSSRP